MENIAFETRDFWDEDFFEDFSRFKNDIYQGKELYIDESPDDLKKELNSKYFELEKVEYKAFIFKHENEMIARVICYFDPNFPEFCSFGHFEILKEYSLHYFMLEQIKKFAKEHNTKSIRGPIQGNFFFSYRMKLDGEFRFYGEPFHQDFYPEIMEEWGFKVSKKWYTEKIVNSKGTSEKFASIKKSSDKKNKRHKIYAKFIFPWRWNEYVKHIHKLFIESYKEMPEYSPIDFETFKTMYDSFKFIINPFLSYIMFHKGEPIGFTITFFDPLKDIFVYQEEMKKADYGWEKVFYKLKLFLKLKLGGGNLLIMYSGKIKGPNGEEFKGIQALASKYISIFFYLFRGKTPYVCYLGDDSPAYKSFSVKNQKPICTYGMYYLNLKEVGH